MSIAERDTVRQERAAADPIRECLHFEAAAALLDLEAALVHPTAYRDIEFHLAGYRSQGGDGKPMYAERPAEPAQYVRRMNAAYAEGAHWARYGTPGVRERLLLAVRAEVACRGDVAESDE